MLGSGALRPKEVLWETTDAFWDDARAANRPEVFGGRDFVGIMIRHVVEQLTYACATGQMQSAFSPAQTQNYWSNMVLQLLNAHGRESKKCHGQGLAANVNDCCHIWLLQTL